MIFQKNYTKLKNKLINLQICYWTFRQSTNKISYSINIFKVDYWALIYYDVTKQIILPDLDLRPGYNNGLYLTRTYSLQSNFGPDIAFRTSDHLEKADLTKRPGPFTGEWNYYKDRRVLL